MKDFDICSLMLQSSRWLLFPLQLWDVFRFVVILEIIIRTFGRGQANASIWIIAGKKNE